MGPARLFAPEPGALLWPLFGGAMLFGALLCPQPLCVPLFGEPPLGVPLWPLLGARADASSQREAETW